MSDARRSIRVIVSGQVQGVGFRAWTQYKARAHGLDGWVRNLQDGRVEAVFSGPAAGVEAMLTDCRRGPRVSRVDGVVEMPAEWSDDRSGFVIAATQEDER